MLYYTKSIIDYITLKIEYNINNGCVKVKIIISKHYNLYCKYIIALLMYYNTIYKVYNIVIYLRRYR